MPTPAELYTGVGGGIPDAPEGTLSIGAVDARPGTKLYEIARRQELARQRRMAITTSDPALSARGRAMATAQAGRHAPRRSKEDILASMLSKMTPGAAAPGEGMIPYGELPQAVQQVAGKVWGQPLVGIDPRQLDNEERFMLEKLRRASAQDVARRVDANPRYAAQMRARGGVM